MTKISTLIVIMFVAIAQIGASEVTQTEAQRIAEQFCSVSNSALAKKKAPTREVMELSHVGKSGGEVCYYAFNRGDGDGYVIVSADDSTDAVLGYADSGSFDFDNMPEAMQWLLGEYEKEIAWTKSHPSSSKPAPRKAQLVKHSVAPLLDCNWSQSEPYNNLCPMHGDVRTYTGCVATAMAQVMYYHKWPKQGQDSNSYEYEFYEDNSQKETLSCDFSKSAYNWENMTANYDESSTQAQCDAVAKLMSDVGISVDMMYGTNASGAYSGNVAEALVKYFDYDETVKFVNRYNYASEDWNNLIYNELLTNGPVYYSGGNTQAGHAFVVDGYDFDGYFHLNWGWGGISNGYFKLAGLDPSSQGIGGSASGYNTDQAAVIGVKPNDGVDSAMLNLVLQYDFRCDVSEANDGDVITFGGYPYNSSAFDAFNFRLGVKVESLSEPESVIYVAQDGVIDQLQPYYGLHKIEVCLGGFKKGSYRITPAACNSLGEWVYVGCDQSRQTSVTMTVDDNGKMTFSNNDTYALEVTNIENVTPFYDGRNFLSKVTIANNGTADYYGRVYIYAFPNASTYYMLSYIAVSIKAGESVVVNFSDKLSSVPMGDYSLYFYDSNKQPLEGLDGTMTVERAPETTSFEVKDVKVTRTECSNVEVALSVNCTEGYCDEPIYVRFATTDWRQCDDTSITPSVKGGETRTYTVTFNAKKYGEVGDNMVIISYYKEAWDYSSKCEFALTADQEVAPKKAVVTKIHAEATADSKLALADMDVTIPLEALGGYQGEVLVAVTDANGKEVGRYVTGLIMDAGEKYSLRCSFPGLDSKGVFTVKVTDGTADKMMVAYSNGAIAQATFNMAQLLDPSGVEQAWADDVKRIEVYTIEGIKVLEAGSDDELSSLPAGLYIVRQLKNNGISTIKIRI